jgi:large subunit ribosomal protein L10
MTKPEKTALIEELADKFGETKFFYLTDFTRMTVKETNEFRRKCFQNNIEMRVVKNKIIIRALEKISETGYEGLYTSLKGHTAVLFAEDGKTPAVMLKDYRSSGKEKPILKAAYIDSDVIVGDDQIDFLTKMKSKIDLLGELLGLLQSPATNLASALKAPEQDLVGALNYGGNTLMGLLKAIEEKNSSAE